MKRSLCFCLIILLAFSGAARCAPDVRGEAVSDDIIRVLLTRFQPTNQLKINIGGSYSCDELYFQRGMELLIGCSGKKGLNIYYEGMVIHKQEKVVLVRHRLRNGAQENGLRLMDSTALYTGDLVLTNNNGMLQAVLHVPLEEYVLGVLPYEMSNSFPLEALKAQAVAARTYALCRKNASRDYDVTDNTNDQVYGGLSGASETIRKAVDQTEGICVYLDGQPVTCYYTASNGGMTETIENVWGMKGDAYRYTVSKKDPYDLENDESVVKTALLPKVISDSEKLPAALEELLKEQASGQMKRMNRSDKPEDIEIIALNDVGLSDDGRSMLFSLKLSAVSLQNDDEEEVSVFDTELGGMIGATQSPQPSPAAEKGDDKRKPVPLSVPVEVTLPIFSQVEKALDLSINQADNELWEITDTKEAFSVSARRFGHGVGLSQRGAQCMASKYHWNYRRILHFYYNGVTLKKINLKHHQLADAVTLDFLATPGPAPTATPRPTLMPVSSPAPDETVVTVDQIDLMSSLNLRAEPNTSSEIIMRLYYGQRLIVIGTEGEWMHVRTDVTEGYVMRKFVSALTDNKTKE